MLYALYGKDIKRTRKKLSALIDSLTKREPHAAHIVLDQETATTDALSAYVSSQGLFASRAIVVLDRITENKETQVAFLEKVRDIAESGNVFIFVDETPDAKVKKALEKYADRVQVFDAVEKEQETFNLFSLTDALGARDRKKLWVLYQQALRSGARPEEIHGVLFWQAKTLLLVAAGDTKTVKAYPARKSQGFLKNYTQDELEALSQKLVAVYTNDRRGIVPFALSLEKLVLEI